MKTPSFAHTIGKSALAGVGRNNICEYLLLEMPLGRHENTEFWWVSHIKLKNQSFQEWAGITYLNIFYLKCLWESFAQNWRIWAFRCGQESYIWISSSWNAFGKASKHPIWWGLHIALKTLGFEEWAGIIYLNIFYLTWLWQGMKTPSFAHKSRESGLAGVSRHNIFEYLLFEMPLGRPQNTKTCGI